MNDLLGLRDVHRSGGGFRAQDHQLSENNRLQACFFGLLRVDLCFILEVNVENLARLDTVICAPVDKGDDVVSPGTGSSQCFRLSAAISASGPWRTWYRVHTTLAAAGGIEPNVSSPNRIRPSGSTM